MKTKSHLLNKKIKEIFIKHGMSNAHAKISAEAIIKAELFGVPSHGLARVKMYCDRLKRKLINPKAKIKIAMLVTFFTLKDLDAWNKPSKPKPANKERAGVNSKK